MTIELSYEKRKNFHDLFLKFKYLTYCSIRKFSQLVSNITAACPAINYGWLHSKKFERQRYLELLNNLIRISKFSTTIFSDASSTRWRATCDGQVVYGHWNNDKKSLHINYLEL